MRTCPCPCLSGDGWCLLYVQSDVMSDSRRQVHLVLPRHQRHRDCNCIIIVINFAFRNATPPHTRRVKCSAVYSVPILIGCRALMLGIHAGNPMSCPDPRISVYNNRLQVILLFFFLTVDAGKKSASAIAAGSVGRAKGICSGGFFVTTGQNSIALCVSGLPVSFCRKPPLRVGGGGAVCLFRLLMFS